MSLFKEIEGGFRDWVDPPVGDATRPRFQGARGQRAAFSSAASAEAIHAGCARLGLRVLSVTGQRVYGRLEMVEELRPDGSIRRTPQGEGTASERLATYRSRAGMRGKAQWWSGSDASPDGVYEVVVSLPKGES